MNRHLDSHKYFHFNCDFEGCEMHFWTHEILQEHERIKGHQYETYIETKVIDIKKEIQIADEKEFFGSESTDPLLSNKSCEDTTSDHSNDADVSSVEERVQKSSESESLNEPKIGLRRKRSGEKMFIEESNLIKFPKGSFGNYATQTTLRFGH